MQSLIDDPRSAGIMGLGLRLMSTPGKFGSALGTAGMGAIDDMRRAQQQKDMQAQRALQQQMLQEQLAEIKRQQEERAKAMQRQQGIEGAYRGAFRSPQQQALAGGGGPTVANAERAQTMQPTIDQQALIAELMKVDPIAAYQMAMPKPDELMSVAPGASVINKRNPGKPVFTAPSAEPKLPGAVQEYEYAKAQGYQGTFEQWELSRRKAGASNISVPINMGQKGFDNTLKLRGDFRSEPIYKAHQDVQSAYSQITTSLKQASPAGDLAGATKLMKILDPGSVVRESELGMAMAASGLLDRVQNYVNMVTSGQKLTPTQRTDFSKLATALFAESEKAYNAKRAEYEGIAKRNGLNVDDVLGPKSVAPQRAKFLGFEGEN